MREDYGEKGNIVAGQIAVGSYVFTCCQWLSHDLRHQVVVGLLSGESKRKEDDEQEGESGSSLYVVNCSR